MQSGAHKICIFGHNGVIGNGHITTIVLEAIDDGWFLHTPWRRNMITIMEKGSVMIIHMKCMTTFVNTRAY